MTKPKQISWRAPEHEFYEKGFKWYLTAILIILTLLAYTIWKKDYLMMIVILVMSGVILTIARKQPKIFSITLSGQGLHLNRDLHPYKNLKYFWINYLPPEVKTLTFETTNYFNRDIVLQLEDQDPNVIREFLMQYLPEDIERQESLTERLQRRLKF